MDTWDPLDSKQICVKTCPTSTMLLPSDVKKFAEETGSRLCDYHVDIKDYNDYSLYKKEGPCPVLPIYKRWTAIIIFF